MCSCSTPGRLSSSPQLASLLLLQASRLGAPAGVSATALDLHSARPDPRTHLTPRRAGRWSLCRPLFSTRGRPVGSLSAHQQHQTTCCLTACTCRPSLLGMVLGTQAALVAGMSEDKTQLTESVKDAAGLKLWSDLPTQHTILHDRRSRCTTTTRGQGGLRLWLPVSCSVSRPT